MLLAYQLDQEQLLEKELQKSRKLNMNTWNPISFPTHTLQEIISFSLISVFIELCLFQLFNFEMKSEKRLLNCVIVFTYNS